MGPLAPDIARASRLAHPHRRVPPVASAQTSTDATLSALTVTLGVSNTAAVLQPPFASDTTGYRTAVPSGTLVATVTATPSDSDATVVVKLDGAVDADGAVALAEGENVITVEVTAENGTSMQTYTVTLRVEIVVNICGRTAEVQRAILQAAVGGATCSTITDTQLADITTLLLYYRGISSLAAGDFDGLTNLEELHLLEDNDITSLGPDIFDGLTSLEDAPFRNRTPSRALTTTSSTA